MNDEKKIRGSSRGLTFTTSDDVAHVGDRFRYIVDPQGRTIQIYLDPAGPMTVSRKKSGRHMKPLFDLRSKAVRNLVSEASYLEIIPQSDGSILVYTRKAGVCQVLTWHEAVALDEILGERTGEIRIPFLRAAGTSYADQISIAEWLSTITNLSIEESLPHADDALRVYHTVSLFSGAGLMDYAFLKTGRFQFVFANDFDPQVAETYEYNIGCPMRVADIRTISPAELPFADLFVTTPCCQAFSNANRHNEGSKEAEAKRLLVDEVVRLGSAKSPEVIVLENVPQFLKKDSGIYLQHLLDGLPEHHFTAKVVADDELGGYSTRRRAIVIGAKHGTIKLPEISVNPRRTVGEALAKVDPTWHNYDDKTKPSPLIEKLMSMIPQGGNWQDLPEKYRSRYGRNTHSNILRRLEPDKPSITLANFRKSNIIHPTENRCLSVAEAAAIMGLDRKFKFLTSSLSAAQQMVANGVTQAIASLVAQSVLRYLDDQSAAAVT